jgi:hypothetical protein
MKMLIQLSKDDLFYFFKHELELEVNGFLCTVGSSPMIKNDSQVSGYCFFDVLKEVPVSNLLPFDLFYQFVCQQNLSIVPSRICKPEKRIAKSSLKQ